MSFIDNIKRTFKGTGILPLLLLFNLAVFLLINITVTSGYRAVLLNMALPSLPELLITKPWTLFTYMFTHQGIGHIFNNLIWMFFMGQIFNVILGEKRLFFVYLFGGLAGALLYLPLAFLSPELGGNGLIGASAAVMAISVAIGIFSPNMPVNLFFFGEVKLKWVVLISFLFSTVIDYTSNTGGKVSHLGGALFGLIYGLQLKKQKDIGAWFTNLLQKKKPKSKLKLVKNQLEKREEKLHHFSKSDEQRLLDEILDKINKTGYESLSKKDKETLHRLSQK